jgi:membrane protein DedA with SNARE-associated domain
MEKVILRRIDLKRFILVVVMAAIATTIASLTIGRDIYHGSASEGMLSFAIVNFTGYLFFLFMPVELAFIYYISEGVNPLILSAVAISTALLSQAIDYLIGYSFSARIVNRLIGQARYSKAETKIRQYGNIIILIFNAMPLSSPVISLSAGMIKYRIKDALLYTIAGLIIKYLLLSLFFYSW